MKTQSQKWKLLCLAAGSLAVAISGWGCGSDNSNNNGSGTATTTTTTTTGTTGPYEQAVLANGPQFYWLLDDSGNQFVDSMVTGNNLQYITTDATLEQQGNSSPINNDGNLALNLYSGYVPSVGLPGLPGDAIAAPSSFSIELWFQEAPGNSGGRIFGFGNNRTTPSTQYDRAIYIDNNGYVHFQINDGAVVDLNASSSVPTCSGYNGACADGIWHYVVAAYDDVSGKMDLYIDGYPTNTTNAPHNIVNYDGYWRLGYDKTASPGAGTIEFNGSIAQVAVYPGALTQTQVNADYAAAGH